MASGTTARSPHSKSEINVKHIGTHVSIRMHLKLGDLSPYTIEHNCCYFDFVLWSISVDVLLLLLLHAQELGEWAHTDIFSNYRIHMHRYMPSCQEHAYWTACVWAHGNRTRVWKRKRETAVLNHKNVASHSAHTYTTTQHREMR